MPALTFLADCINSKDILPVNPTLHVQLLGDDAPGLE